VVGDGKKKVGCLNEYALRYTNWMLDVCEKKKGEKNPLPRRAIPFRWGTIDLGVCPRKNFGNSLFHYVQ